MNTVENEIDLPGIRRISNIMEDEVRHPYAKKDKASGSNGISKIF